jgi:Flp pilus assembly pilin Flp
MARNLRERLPRLALYIGRLLRDERAQTLAEYGLIISVIAVGVVIPFMLIFRQTLIEAYLAAAGCLDGSC